MVKTYKIKQQKFSYSENCALKGKHTKKQMCLKRWAFARKSSIDDQNRLKNKKVINKAFSAAILNG